MFNWHLKDKSENESNDDEVVDLTDDTPEETKTSAIDATKKALLKKLLMAKMAEGSSSSSSSGSDSDSGSDDDDDLILVDELKPTKPKRTFKRRNGNVTQNDDDENGTKMSQQLPQPKDAMLTSDLMNKLLEADKLDEN